MKKRESVLWPLFLMILFLWGMPSLIEKVLPRSSGYIFMTKQPTNLWGKLKENQMLYKVDYGFVLQFRIN